MEIRYLRTKEDEVQSATRYQQRASGPVRYVVWIVIALAFGAVIFQFAIHPNQKMVVPIGIMFGFVVLINVMVWINKRRARFHSKSKRQQGTLEEGDCWVDVRLTNVGVETTGGKTESRIPWAEVSNITSASEFIDILGDRKGITWTIASIPNDAFANAMIREDFLGKARRLREQANSSIPSNSSVPSYTQASDHIVVSGLVDLNELRQVNAELTEGTRQNATVRFVMTMVGIGGLMLGIMYFTLGRIDLVSVLFQVGPLFVMSGLIWYFLFHRPQLNIPADLLSKTFFWEASPDGVRRNWIADESMPWTQYEKVFRHDLGIVIQEAGQFYLVSKRWFPDESAFEDACQKAIAWHQSATKASPSAKSLETIPADGHTSA